LATHFLGDEFDDALRLRLGDVLRQFGARKEATETRGIAGSQEFESMSFIVDGAVLTVESATYFKIRKAVLGEP
jgi:hypothetical protein